MAISPTNGPALQRRHHLWDNTPGGILISFDTPVFGAGAYIAGRAFRRFHRSSISCLTPTSTHLGTFSTGALRTQPWAVRCSSALLTAQADVSCAIVRLHATMINFAIGTLRIQTGQEYRTTPEPGTLLLLGPSLLGAAGVLRRRMSRKEVL